MVAKYEQLPPHGKQAGDVYALTDMLHVCFQVMRGCGQNTPSCTNSPILPPVPDPVILVQGAFMRLLQTML